MKEMNDAQSMSLDIFRVFAVQLVVMGHGLSYFNILQADYIQNLAVLLFFILSGIVISYSTFCKINKDKNYNFKLFFIDRFSRIYSGLVPSLIFIFMIDLIQISYLKNTNYMYFNAFNFKTFLGNLLMLQDFPVFQILTSFGSGRPLWTLAIEWWLYMSFGILVFYYEKIFKKKYLLVIFLLILIVPLYNTFAGRGNALSLFWLGGMLVSIILFKNNIKICKNISLFFTLVLFVVAFARLCMTLDGYDMVFACLLVCLFACFLSYMSYISYSSTKLKKIIHLFASYSFTLYLVHYSILDLAYFFSNKNSLSLFVISFLICNMIAFSLAYFTEMKYKNFRCKLIKVFSVYEGRYKYVKNNNYC